MRKKEKITEDLKKQQMFAQEFQDELQSSYEMIKKLLPFIVKRNIPASPINYRIFYDYLANNNPSLCKTVQGLLDKNVQFHTKLSESLYKHFYVGETVSEAQASAIKKAASDFMHMSQDLVGHLSNAKDQTCRYQKTLSDSSKQLGCLENNKLQAVVEELVVETEAALAAHEMFSLHITEANDIIDILRRELENQTNLANIDELTQLYNRRHLQREALPMMAACQNDGLPLTMALFDLDFFKRINDTWGHNIGDKVLITCAGIIKSHCRENDLPIRLGGEEFIMLLQPMTLEDGAAKAEEVRLEIYNTDITVRGERLPVTISAGVAQYNIGESLSSFIDRADKALYRAKRDGRNTVRIDKNMNQ